MQNGFVRKIKNVTLEFQDVDSSYYFVSFISEDKDLCLKIVLRGFLEEMDFWDIEVKSGIHNGIHGFFISKETDVFIIETEIERFI